MIQLNLQLFYNIICFDFSKTNKKISTFSGENIILNFSFSFVLSKFCFFLLTYKFKLYTYTKLLNVPLTTIN